MYLLLLHDYCTAPPHTHTRNIICLVLTETFFNLYCFLLLLPLTSPQTTDSLGTQTVGKFGLSARDDFLAWVILFATVPIIGTRLTLLHTSPANTRLFYHKATEETGTGQELVATATKLTHPSISSALSLSRMETAPRSWHHWKALGSCFALVSSCP